MGEKSEDVQTQSSISEKPKSCKDTDINNPDCDIDRGFEFILTGGKQKEEQSKTFRILLNPIISFLKREINIKFDLSLSISKKN